MNRVSALILLGVAVLSGVLWLRWHDKQVRDTALLVQKDSVIEALRQAVAAAEVVRLAKSAEHDAIRRQLEVANRRSAAHDSALRVTANRLDSALHAVIPPDLKPMLDSLISTFQGRLAEKDSIIARQELALRDALGDKAECDEAAVRLTKLADDALAARDAWKERAQPGLLKQILAGLPYAAGGGLVVAVVVVIH